MRKKVAIVGLSHRFPVGKSGAFWPGLLAGENFVSEVESSRWAMETFRHPEKSHPGTSYTFAAGSIGDIAGFDAAFFGISPREAVQMDPQQRLLLELTWEALENASILPAKLRGKKCGVYIGISSNDYGLRFADDPSAIDSGMGTGNTASIAANRISYVFDLRGPSMAIDTACSSSLVAFHQACQSILSGESDLAITGGVSLHAHPYGFIAFSKASMLSRQGMCNVFDAACDGYVRSEGGAIVLLKDLERAQADGDHILGVVAASAVNSDGRKSGLTIPSADAQAELLKDVYRQAEISPDDIDYIEAHGTGTPVGDPIEAHALGKAIGQMRSKGRKLLIGSVKSNLGHLEPVSGMAGLAKVLYAMEHRVIPATINIQKLNPNIPFDDWNLLVVRDSTPLRPTGRLVLGVNSFGFGGANAHVIIESPSPRVSALATKPRKAPVNALVPVIFTAKSAPALRAVAQRYGALLGSRRDHYHVAHSIAFEREWHQHRAVVWGRDSTSLAESLEAFAEGKADRTEVETGTRLAETAAQATFVFSGNGSQWEGMGRQLLADEPLFRAAIRRIDAIFQPLAGFTIEEMIGDPAARGGYARTELAQPALFAVQVGIVEMLRSRGILPGACVGHSVGEVAAAWCSGALTLEQAVQVIFHRSRLQGLTKGDGQMTAVLLSADAVCQFLEKEGLRHKVTLAAANSSRGSTLAGSVTHLEEVETALRKQSIGFKRLDLDYAFHSDSMNRIESALYKALGALAPTRSAVPFYSTVTGDQLGGTFLDAFYWWQNVRNPVLFETAIRRISSIGPTVFVEIGPHAVLKGYVADCLKVTKAEGRVLPTLSRGKESASLIWTVASQAIISGVTPAWAALFPVPGRRLQLPNYPWQRERFWHQPTQEAIKLLDRRNVHPLLGYRLSTAVLTWENQLDTHRVPMLADHRVGDAVVLPSTGFAEIALAAAAQWMNEPILRDHPSEVIEVEELEIRAPLILEAARSNIVRVSIDPADGTLQIKSRAQADDSEWTVNVVSRLLRDSKTTLMREKLGALPTRKFDFERAAHAELTESAGLHYGPSFLPLSGGWTEIDDDTVLTKLALPLLVNADVSDYLLHPALLDCAFQMLVHLLYERGGVANGMAYVPSKIGRILLRRGRGTPTWARAMLLGHSPHSVLAEFALFDAEGECVSLVKGVRLKSVRLLRDQAEHLRVLRVSTLPMPTPSIAHVESLSGPEASFARVIAREMTRGAAGLASEPYYSSYEAEVEPLLDVLSSTFAAEALGANSSTLAPAVLGESNLRAKLVNLLQEDGLLEAANESGDVDIAQIKLPSAREVWSSLVSEYPDHFVAINALARVSNTFHAGLAHAGEATQPAVSGSIVSTLSRYLIGPSAKNALLKSIWHSIERHLSQSSAGTRFCVIEIGAETPLFGGDLLSRIDHDRCDYVFATTNASLNNIGHLDEKFYGVTIESIDTLGVAAASAKPYIHGPGRQTLVVVHCDFANSSEAERVSKYAQSVLAHGGTLLWIEAQLPRWADVVLGAHGIDGSIKLASASGGYRRISREQVVEHRRQALRVHGFAECSPFPVVGDRADGPVALLFDVPNQPVAGASTPREMGGSWLLIGGKANKSDPLVAELQSQFELAGASLTLHDGTCDTRALMTFLQAQFRETKEPAGILFLAGKDVGVSGHDDGRARCAQLAALAQALEKVAVSVPCVVVTSSAQLNPSVNESANPHFEEMLATASLRGFVRTLMNEPGCCLAKSIDIAVGGHLQRQIATLLQELTASDAEDEVLISADGERFVPRLCSDPTATMAVAEKPDHQNERVTRLGFTNPGQLRNLRWVSQEARALRSDEVEIDVVATGLNFRDVMYALGLLSDEAVENGFAGATLGLECAGVVKRVGDDVDGYAVGDRVVAFGPASFADRVFTNVNAVAHLPGNLSFEAGATIPGAFFTAYYALHHIGRISPGERVLIHGAAGGVGIAAIQIARHFGAQIFATAGSDEKRDFVRMLGADHVFDSRSLDFADEIMLATGGEGVDIVLNSLAGEAINRNLRILKPFGRFLELGKRDFYENSKIGLRPFRNNISFFGIDADQLMQEQPALTQRLFREMMYLFTDGQLHPLPFQIFEADDVVEAFRHMQQARQIGKVVVTYYNGIRSVQPAASAKQHRLELNGNATYLVTGGLSGFGLRTASWLAERGAKHLVLLGRKGISTAEAKQSVAALTARGVTVHAAACDVSDRSALYTLFAQIDETMPPLRGVIHAAAVIEDSLVRNIDQRQIGATFAAKATGASNLHHCTQSLPLDFFVLYSSATTYFGNPGQASYVAANCYLEELARQRHAMGLPATAIGWGAIDDVGFLARNAEIKDQLQSRMGGHAIRSNIALDFLEKALLNQTVVCGVMEIDWRALSRFLPTASSPKFSRLAVHAADSAPDQAQAEDIQRLLAECSSEELTQMFIDILKQEIGEILRLSTDKIDVTRSVYDMGLDSLMGVELVLAIESRFGIRLSVMALSEGPTITKLAEKILAQLQTMKAGVKPDVGAETAMHVQQLVSQHAADIPTEAVESFVTDINSVKMPQSGRMIR